MSAINCAACRFARAYPPPGDEPTPPAKKGFWAKLWDGDRDWFDYEWKLIDHSDAKRRHEKLVLCERFPESVVKFKADTCGEFLP